MAATNGHSSSLKGALFIGVPSLKVAPERRKFIEQGFREQFGALQVCGVDVYFHEVDLDPEGGVVGCTRSHVAIWRKALEAGCKACLVLEDDVKPNAHLTEEVVRQCVELADFWDIIRLHRTGICKIHAHLFDGFHHVSQLSGECYVVGKALMEHVCNAPEKETIPFTRYVAKQTGRMVCYDPTAITEGVFGSYNSAGFGHGGGASMGLKMIQKSLENSTFLLSCINNFHWWTNCPSDLLTKEGFPYQGTLNCSFRKETKTTEEHAKQGKSYTKLGLCFYCTHRRRTSKKKD